MLPEPEKFISEVTLCLYSSLNIEEALYETFKYLSRHFPLELAHMFIFDTSKGSLRYLAVAYGKRGVLIDETVQISEASIMEVRASVITPVTVFTKSGSPVIREIFEHFQSTSKHMLFSPEDDLSALAILFDIGQPFVGGFGLVARGGNVYNEKHKKYLAMIQRPLAGSVLNLLHHREIVCMNERLASEKRGLEEKLGHASAGRIVGSETGLKEVADLVRKVAPLGSPVLLTGETGVGKEIIANAIHQSSARSNGPMISINCGAIPESLIDSELFGHEKGAFTGATSMKRGYFEQANGGTIFLDEIGELPLAAQVKLLRVLQTMEFHRVGGSRTISVDVRVIAATNRDLREMVKKHDFREDLWFRLNVFPIKIPPLRDRKNDIPALAEYFAIRKAREMNLPSHPGFAADAFFQLMAYDWPGNIRELQNVIERALIISRGNPLSFTGLSTEKKQESRPEYQTNIEGNTLPQTIDSLLKNHIEKTLEMTGGRVEGEKGAAAILGLNPSTLRGKMRKLGISIEKRIKL